MLRHFLLLLLIGMLLPGYSQSGNAVDKTEYLEIGAGLGLQSFRDDAMSPLLYNGYLTALSGAIHTEKGRSAHRIEGWFLFGPTSAPASGAETFNYNFAIHGSYLHQIGDPAGAWHWAVGGTLESLNSFRDHESLTNSDYFYDVFLSVGPTGQVSRSFRWLGRDWRLRWQLGVPVLSYGVRPSYSGLYEAPPGADDEVAQALREGTVGSFGVLTQVRSRAELIYRLRNGNGFGLVYFSDYYRSEVLPLPVRQLLQSFQLNVHVKL